MNFFDQSITLFVNQYACRSWLFDSLVVFLSEQNLLKGGLTFSLFWYAWFRPCEEISQNRRRLVSTLVACFIALALGRVLQLTLPFRQRPLHTLELNFTLPHGLESKTLEGWSSLPSDHATLFFALSTGLFLVSRPLGLFSFFHTITVICFPRLYLGLHFSTDLITGALIGIVSSYLLCFGKNCTDIGRRALVWEKHSPSFFYSGLFIFTFEMATLFDNVRSIALTFLKALRAVSGYP
jgi:undecaprenyl-diphosphatase